MCVYLEYLEECNVANENGDTQNSSLVNEDPIKTAFLEIELEKEKKPAESRKSILLIFYGAPNTSALFY